MDDARQDALRALERLVYQHRVVSEEQARAAARLIVGDPTFDFPAPPAEPPESAVANNSSLSGSESL